MPPPPAWLSVFFLCQQAELRPSLSVIDAREREKQTYPQIRAARRFVGNNVHAFIRLSFCRPIQLQKNLTRRHAAGTQRQAAQGCGEEEEEGG